MCNRLLLEMQAGVPPGAFPQRWWPGPTALIPCSPEAGSLRLTAATLQDVRDMPRSRNGVPLPLVWLQTHPIGNPLLQNTRFGAVPWPGHARGPPWLPRPGPHAMSPRNMAGRFRPSNATPTASCAGCLRRSLLAERPEVGFEPTRPRSLGARGPCVSRPGASSKEPSRPGPEGALRQHGAGPGFLRTVASARRSMPSRLAAHP